MKSIAIGIDVSKGYADFCFMDDSDGEFDISNTYDDTPEGHKQIRSHLQQLSDRYNGDIKFQVGVESTGGYEKNWLGLFNDLQQKYDLKPYPINPLVIRRFREQFLHHNTNDEISARTIARYLRRGVGSKQTYEPQLEGARKFARLIKKVIDQKTNLQNDFQTMLVQVHPYLVQFTRNGVPKWVFRVVKAFPIATPLARANPEEVSEIPYVTRERANQLIAYAQESIASGREELTGLAIQTLAEELLNKEAKINEMKDRLWEHLKDDEGIKILQTIPGINKWSACLLRVEIRSIFRFPTPEALVANYGLDSQISKSGDDTSNRSISKRGSSIVRWILYICQESARQKSPVFKGFYERLRGKGKHHFVAAVAGMRKMLHIIHACWVKGEPFDPEYESRLKKEIERKKQQKQKDPSDSQNQNQQEKDLEKRLEAPISRREAQKRKEVTLPQGKVTSHSRGLVTSDDSS